MVAAVRAAARRATSETPPEGRAGPVAADDAVLPPGLSCRVVPVPCGVASSAPGPVLVVHGGVVRDLLGSVDSFGDDGEDGVEVMRGWLVAGGISVGVLVLWLLVHAVWVAVNCTSVLGTQVCR